MKHNHYNKKLKSYASRHRNMSTRAEIRLWCELLRNKKMMGFPFLRQRAIGNYIADFFCKELQLVIETDGGSHLSKKSQLADKRKEGWLNCHGYTVLRFQDNDVMDNLEWVKNTIEKWIKENSSNFHPPLPQ